MTVYVVEGSTGEYSDHREWVVMAFRSEAKAADLVVKAQARANEIEIAKNADDSKWWDHYDSETKPPEFTNEYDPQMQINYTGTHYTYYPVELDE